MQRLLSCLLVAIPLISTAHAQTQPAIVLYSGTAEQLSHVSTDFRIEPTSGQAWVQLFVAQGFHTEDLYERQLRVDGLGYNAETQQIVYASADGTPVVCANTASRGQGWFKRTRITPTGQCPIVTQSAYGNTFQSARLTPSQPVSIVMMPLQAP